MSATAAHTLQPGDRLIRRDEVERLTGLSRSSIYWRNQHDPEWPKAVPLGPNTGMRLCAPSGWYLRAT